MLSNGLTQSSRILRNLVLILLAERGQVIFFKKIACFFMKELLYDFLVFGWPDRETRAEVE